MVRRMAPRRQHKNGSNPTSPPSPHTASPSPRVVLHVDLDSFFVQVERSLNPTLIGKPMCVFQHADVVAVSYEARKLGVKKHMPTTTIRREYPSVKLVHVQTIGLQNDKVSYRNYRAAARAIFTLVQAFCPAEDVSNGTGGRGGGGGVKPQTCGGETAEMGKFQKASVDEAYLEPTRRALMTELLLSSERGKNKPGTAAEGSMAPNRAPRAAELLRAAVKRPRRTDSSVSGGVVFSAAFSEHPWHDGDYDDDGCAPLRVEYGKEPIENQDGMHTTEGCDFVDDDGNQDGFQRQRRRDLNARTGRAEEKEEAQLLEAGGLLGRRIQQTLRDVLKYDCSVGVAGNKFLAKLATNLAKPRGVCVLPRRDVSALLAATPATKIPGCGVGSAAAKQFVAWGARTVVDLRRIEATEMRQRLGEKQGMKVFDRCRGIDNDPVEPDPIPSKVSSQLSLVPLISPAHCFGKPGEKLTPVFPWEVERVKPFLVTLVDDLMDRMKEEVAERHRRPTKLCIEHHLFQHGSKSQTFALSADVGWSCRPRATPTTSTAEGVDDGHQRPKGTFAPNSVVEDETADSVGLLGLPPAASLVELVLTPFKNYRSSRAVAASGGAEAQRRRGTEEGRADMNRRSEILPPVVKLIVSLLGFESLGPTPPTAAPPGQRTLRGMMWLKNDDALSSTAAALKISANDTTRSSGDASPPPSGRIIPDGLIAAERIAHSPVPDSVPIRSPSTCGVVRAQNIGGILEKGGRKSADGAGDLSPQAAEEGSVFVRCPSCKACLPVGNAWDVHREEHMSAVGPAASYGADALRLLPSEKDASSYQLPPEKDASSYRLPVNDQNACGLELRPPSASLGVANDGTAKEQDIFIERAKELGGIRESEDNAFSSNAAIKAPSRDAAAVTNDCPCDRSRSRKLSDLLMSAVSPDQAADVLRQRGFLADNGQTRFAKVGREGRRHQLE